VQCREQDTLRLWNIESGREVRRLDGHDAGALIVTFSKDGQRILSSGWGDRTVRLWDVASRAVRLWVLESGTGGVVLVECDTGRRETTVKLPGFTRGWAIAGPYAFVGLSKIRATSAMDGIPIAERRNELKCGVAAIDLRSGIVIGILEFQTAVEEIFDVQLLIGIRFPEVIGFQKDEVHNTFVVPSTA
jgi:hypothetical protein